MKKSSVHVHGKSEGIYMAQNREEIEQTKYKCTGRLMLYMYLIYILYLCYKCTIHLRGRRDNDLPKN